jgi:hypothetical protein
MAEVTGLTAADHPLRPLCQHLPRRHRPYRGIRCECPIHAAGTTWLGHPRRINGEGQRPPGRIASHHSHSDHSQTGLRHSCTRTVGRLQGCPRPIPATLAPVASSRLPFLWLYGPTGVGKSSVGYAIFQQVRRSGIKVAYVDLDQVGLCYPSPADDPHNHREGQNLGAVWPVYRAAGARCLIAVGAVPSREIVMTYAGKVPDTDLTLCRLRAGPECLTERVFRRGLGRGPVIPGPPAAKSKRLLAGAAAEAIRQAASWTPPTSPTYAWIRTTTTSGSSRGRCGSERAAGPG